MSLEENKNIATAYFNPKQGWEELNRQIETATNRAAFIEKDSREAHARSFTPDFVMHTTIGDMSYDDVVQFDIVTLSSYRDLSYTVDDVIAEGDKVVVRYTMCGTARDSVMGIPAAGKQLTVSGIMVNRISSGKISEAWVVSDVFGMMLQLGAVPPLEMP